MKVTDQRIKDNIAGLDEYGWYYIPEFFEDGTDLDIQAKNTVSTRNGKRYTILYTYAANDEMKEQIKEIITQAAEKNTNEDNDGKLISFFPSQVSPSIIEQLIPDENDIYVSNDNGEETELHISIEDSVNLKKKLFSNAHSGVTKAAFIRKRRAEEKTEETSA